MSHKWFAVKNVWKFLSRQPLWVPGSCRHRPEIFPCCTNRAGGSRAGGVPWNFLPCTENQTLVYCHVESVKLWIDLTPHGCSGKCSQLTNPSLGLFTALLSLVTSIWDNFFIFMTCKEYPEKPNLLPNKQSHFWFIFELSVWFPEIWLCLGRTSRLKLCLTPTDSWTLP